MVHILHPLQGDVGINVSFELETFDERWLSLFGRELCLPSSSWWHLLLPPP